MAVEYCNIFAFKLDHDIVALVTTPVSVINVEFGYRNGPAIAKGGKYRYRGTVSFESIIFPIPAGHQGRAGKRTWGEAFRGDSYPLLQGVPFVQCCFPSYFAPWSKVHSLIWTEHPAIDDDRSRRKCSRRALSPSPHFPHLHVGI